MDVNSTKFIEELDPQEILKKAKTMDIVISPHATDYLSEGQRKLFNGEKELVYYIKGIKATKTYIQANKRYVAFYRIDEGYRKIILDIQPKRIVIVTFMKVIELPKVNL